MNICSCLPPLDVVGKLVNADVNDPGHVDDCLLVKRDHRSTDKEKGNDYHSDAYHSDVYNSDNEYGGYGDPSGDEDELSEDEYDEEDCDSDDYSTDESLSDEGGYDPDHS